MLKLHFALIRRKIFFRNLDCGNHTCEAICHAGDCESCILLPEKVKYCPCKQTMVADLLPIGEERRSCLDPIPCCGNFCGKKLQCGPKGKPIINFNTWQMKSLYNTIHCNTIQYIAIHYSTMQCSLMRYSSILCHTIQYNTIQYKCVYFP